MHRFASPSNFTRLSRFLLPCALALALPLLAYGLYLVFYVAPPDYQQGITVRIMYVHVPAAWLGMGLYAGMALLSASFLIWKHALAATIAREMAVVGAAFTLICLITGMLWGKPMWGAYWVWDARLTSMLMLLFLYVGFLALHANASGQERTLQVASWIGVIGVLNVPIIKFSVDWWNSLHQPASVLRAGGPTIAPEMLVPLMIMALGFFSLALALVLWRSGTALQQQKLQRLQFMAIRRNAARENFSEET